MVSHEGVPEVHPGKAAHDMAILKQYDL